MVMTVEEKKAYDKAYREANKEKIAEYKKAYSKEKEKKIAEYKKAWYDKNKDKISEWGKTRYQANKNQIVAQNKAYRKTEAGKKTHRMSAWRLSGVNNVNDELYDYFMSCDKCEACGGEFSENNKKCLDHNHETGDFRYVLCTKCNVMDNWKKIILNHTDTL